MQDKEVSFNLVFFHARKDHLNKVLPVGENEYSENSNYLMVFSRLCILNIIIQPSEKIKIKRFQAMTFNCSITKNHAQVIAASSTSILPELEEWIDPSLRRGHGIEPSF